MWFCRLAPVAIVLAVASLVVDACVFGGLPKGHSLASEFRLVAYGCIFIEVFVIIPNLLYEGKLEGSFRSWWWSSHPDYFIYALFTMGIYPIVRYFREVDPVLAKMVKAREKE